MSVELTIETVTETVVLEVQDHVPAIVTIDTIPELREELDDKVDAEAGKQLSDENYTLAEKDKLSGIAAEATKNRDDSENADKVHDHDISDVDGLSTRLNDIDALVGDVESVLVAINGEP